MTKIQRQQRDQAVRRRFKAGWKMAAVVPPVRAARRERRAPSRPVSRGALSLDRQCQLAGLPMPVAEHKFHSTRQWRLDWAFLPPVRALAVEVEGGAFTRGRHTRGVGFEADLVKYAEALMLGWVILRVTPRMVNDGTALGWIERLLKG